jgi:hypothetical protein
VCPRGSSSANIREPAFPVAPISVIFTVNLDVATWFESSLILGVNRNHK